LYPIRFACSVTRSRILKLPLTPKSLESKLAGPFPTLCPAPQPWLHLLIEPEIEYII
jgi:hypothetical protein